MSRHLKQVYFILATWLWELVYSVPNERPEYNTSLEWTLEIVLCWKIIPNLSNPVPLDYEAGSLFFWFDSLRLDLYIL